jgi:lysyl-tRNA synthetase class 1
MFPGMIYRKITAKGAKARYIFVADILDAFDSVPASMMQYEKELSPHLGKPLCDVPDPTGKNMSFGDYFLGEVRELMKRFGTEAEVLRANDLYVEGKFDKMIKFFLENEAQAKELIERVSMKQEKKDWSAIMPICTKCGKIATTRVLSHDGENYEYICDKDVKYTKGCGYQGKNKITDHKCKLTWRLHWPAWMEIFGTSIEGAGMDHHTKGGSWDTTVAVFKEMLKKKPPVGFKFGFILFQGKKYSKSKGIGMGVSDLIQLLPVEIIKYLLVKPDLEENIDINPTPDSLLKVYDEFQRVAELNDANPDMAKLDRHNEKSLQAYRICTDKRNWKTQFLDVLLYYQIYGNWDEVGKMTGDAHGTGYLKPYVEEWIKREFIPEEYRFKYQPSKEKAGENVLKLVSGLDNKADALAIHNAVFEYAKVNGIEPKEMFKQVYLALIGKERGPRVGKLVYALGVERVKRDLLNA